MGLSSHVTTTLPKGGKNGRTLPQSAARRAALFGERCAFLSSAIPEAKVVALCDVYGPHVARGLQACGNPGAKRYKDYHDLLADPKVEAVVIATPDHWHEKRVLDAVAAGKAIYCEKGLTISIAAMRTAPARMRTAFGFIPTGRRVRCAQPGSAGALSKRTTPPQAAGHLMEAAGDKRVHPAISRRTKPSRRNAAPTSNQAEASFGACDPLGINRTTAPGRATRDRPIQSHPTGLKGSSPAPRTAARARATRDRPI